MTERLQRGRGGMIKDIALALVDLEDLEEGWIWCNI